MGSVQRIWPWLMLPLAVCGGVWALQVRTPVVSAPSEEGYAPSSSCAACHQTIWRSYRETGMGRAFSLPSPQNVAAGSYFHEASASHFTIVERSGRFYQRRHQVAANGREENVLEKSIDFVMGSGNHARTYLHRTPRGKLLELPLGWYAEQGGYLAMNPGYDTAGHEGFRRKVGYECMYCHNGYPRIPSGHDQPGAEPVYLEPLPLGIDCQRCHGPARRHVRLAGSGAAREAVRAAIVNPARLTPERREEVCIQCHLETTSFPLPNSLARYGRGPFSFQPGERLSDAWLFFDHAPGTGREDKFEIVNAVYRMRKSRCFTASKGALECRSCHNPHDVPRGDAARRYYDAACQKCHSAAEAKHSEDTRQVMQSAPGGCAGCHMPKRRTEDVVHAVATDHLIQRSLPAGSLTAPRPERHERGATAYRGEVALYYPPRLEATVENELYLALAQVADNTNLKAGIPRLRAALARAPEARPEFHLALAEALSASGDVSAALPHYREAARRDARSAFAARKLGIALRQAGILADAVAVLRRATEMAPKEPLAWHELGLAYQAQGKLAEAIMAMRNAIALDPDLPEPQSNLGATLLAAGETRQAEAAFREAIRLQPEYADAHDNLANLLAAKGAFEEARTHFEAALRLRPADARTHYNYAMALGRARLIEDALAHLEAAVRADSQFLDARLVLADLRMARQETQAALTQYREAVRIDGNSARARLGLGMALAAAGNAAEALPHLRVAAQASDARIREAALQFLRQLGR